MTVLGDQIIESSTKGVYTCMQPDPGIEEFLAALKTQLDTDLASVESRPRLAARSDYALFRTLKRYPKLHLRHVSLIDAKRQAAIDRFTNGQNTPLPETLAYGRDLARTHLYECRLVVGSEADRQSSQRVMSLVGLNALVTSLPSLVRNQSANVIHPDYLDYLSVNDRILLGSRQVNDRASSEDWYILPTEDVDAFKLLWSDRTSSFSRNTIGVSPEEPLWRTAGLMHRISTFVCQGSYINSSDCSWYHGAWQYLRLAGKASTPGWHKEFFLDGIADSFRRRGDARVLVSGAADYSMLAHVIAGSGGVTNSLPPAVRVTVADGCRTPLLMSEWYTRHRGIRAGQIEYQQVDLLHARNLAQLGKNRPFDLIVSDAFLTRFHGAIMPQILANWRGLLAVGGSVLTTVRISPPQSEKGNEERLAQDYVASCMARLRRWRPYIDLDPISVRRLVEGYARTMRSERLGSAQDILTAFAKAGFEIVNAEESRVPGELEPSDYLRIRARATSQQAVSSERTITVTSTGRNTGASTRPPLPYEIQLIGEAIPHLVIALRRQTNQDPSWANNLGGAVFAAHAHAALGDAELYGRISGWVGQSWTLAPDQLPRPTRAVTHDYRDFPEIVSRMRHAGLTDDSLDVERFHRTWALGVLLTFESDAPIGDVARSHMLVSIARTVQLPSGAFYPAEVPWVTARVLLGLGRIQRNQLVECGEVINLAQQWLLSRASLGWDPGTAGWNSAESTTALVLNSLLQSGVEKDNGVVQTAIDLALLQDPERWSVSQNVQACAEVMYALLLAGRSIDDFVGEQMELLQWARSTEALAVPAAEAVARGEESPRLPYVLSLLIDILKGDDRFGSLDELGVIAPNLLGVSSETTSIRRLLTDATDWKQVLEAQQLERNIDLGRMSAGAAHDRLRSSYLARHVILDELQAVISDMISELNGASVSGSALRYERRLAELRSRVQSVG